MLSFGNSLDNHYKTHFLNDAQRLIIRCPFFISHVGLHYVNNFLVTVIQCTWTVFVHVCIWKLLIFQLWAKSIDQAKKLYKASLVVRNQGDAIGVLVGAPNPYILSNHLQHEIANLCIVPDDEVQDTATSYWSIWKPTRGFSGLLYRVNENAIVVSQQSGEVVVTLQKMFRVPVADESMYFVCAKPFRGLGFNGNEGRLVQEGYKLTVFPVENISRKFILAKDEDVAGQPSYLVVDFMRCIFPVTPGTIVVPFYPCVNGMIYVRGDDADTIWRARVLAFNITRHSVTGRFFKKRDDDVLWVPEGTRN